MSIFRALNRAVEAKNNIFKTVSEFWAITSSLLTFFSSKLYSW
jgi:hypothetical protein